MRSWVARLRDTRLMNAVLASWLRNASLASLPRRENRVLAVQSKDASRPRHYEANLFDPPPIDLRDYLTKKRSANQITSSCCCQRLITMLSECRCNSGANQQSLVRQLTLIPRSAKRSRSHRRRVFSDTEYPELTANMVSRSRGK